MKLYKPDDNPSFINIEEDAFTELPNVLRLEKDDVSSSDADSSSDSGRPIDETEEEFEIERVLDERRIHGRTQFLVRWVDYGPEDDSWVDANELHAPEKLADFNAKRNL